MKMSLFLVLILCISFFFKIAISTETVADGGTVQHYSRMADLVMWMWCSFIHLGYHGNVHIDDPYMY